MGTRNVRVIFGGGALALATLFAGADLHAQDLTGWQPFLGCWQPDTDNAEGTLCFVENGSQVDMLTIVDGAVELREYFAADGTQRNIDQDGCRGTESARFSDDRARIYTYSDLTCEDAPRRSSGIISMTTPNVWIDVRAIDDGNETMAWVQRYRRADSSVLTDLGLAAPQRPGRITGRQFARRAMDELRVDALLDAAAQVDDEAVEAWVAESGKGVYNLDAEDLIALDDAGVSADVIDIVVAVSFPGRFAVGRDDEYDRGYYGGRGARPIYGSRYYDPYWYPGYSSFFGFGYGGYGYGYPYYGFGYRPVRVIVGNVRGGLGGRIINGLGYRRGGRSSTGSARPASGGRSSVGSSGRSRSGGAASSGGRRAKRRGGR